MRGSFVLVKPRNPLRYLAGYGVGLWPAWLAWRAESGDRSYLSNPAIRCAAWRATGVVCGPHGWLGGPNAGIFRACQTPQSAALLGGLREWFVARMAGLEGRMRGSFALAKPRNPLRCLAGYGNGL